METANKIQRIRKISRVHRQREKPVECRPQSVLLRVDQRLREPIGDRIVVGFEMLGIGEKER